MNYIYSNMGTAMDAINPEGDSTNVNFKKQGVKTETASGRIMLMIPGQAGWKEKVFDQAKERIIISENAQESDLPPNTLPAFKGSLVMQKCDDKWIVLNSGRAGAKFAFNGRNANHFMVGKGEKTLVACDNGMLFIMIYLNNEGRVRKALHEGHPKGDEFSLMKDGAEHCYPRDSVCLLGKHQCCDLATAADSDFTAAIYEKNREFHVAPLDPKTAILVNSAPATEPRVILRGSTLSIGNNHLTFNLPDSFDSAEVKMSTGIERINAEKLVFIPAMRNSDGTRKSMLYVPAPGKSGFVGRDASQAHVVVNSKTVSKKHAQIISYDTNIMLLDCYSTNGTYVNGERISKRTVHPGDIVEFGEEKFILSYV